MNKRINSSSFKARKIQSQDSSGNYGVALTWEQRVALILIEILKDVYLVTHFIQFYRSYSIEDSRKFHISLRISPSQRWTKLNEMSQKRDFSRMNPCVPITCDLPFNGEEWRISKNIRKCIELLFPGFINIVKQEYDFETRDPPWQDPNLSEEEAVRVFLGVQPDYKSHKEIINLYLKEKVKAVNKICPLNSGFCILSTSISRALKDFKETIQEYSMGEITTALEEGNLPCLQYNISCGRTHLIYDE